MNQDQGVGIVYSVTGNDFNDLAIVRSILVSGLLTIGEREPLLSWR